MNSQSLIARPANQLKAATPPVERAVLLIDDDPSVLHGLARALRHQPYRIYTATSGEEAMLTVKGREIERRGCR